MLQRAIRAWTSVSVVVDTTLTSLYIDGVLAAQAANFAPALARFTLGGVVGGSEIYAGSIDELRVYERALTAEEVLTLYTMEDTASRCFTTRSLDIPSAGWNAAGLLAIDASSTFRLVPGLTGAGTVSIESCDVPGHFFRHAAGARLYLQQNDASAQFAADASWFLKEDAFQDG